MARISLKKIIQRDSEIATIIEQLIVCAGEPVAISDGKGKWLIGDESTAKGSFHMLQSEGNPIGKVYGSAAVKPLVNFIHLLIHRELERRKLGTEILDLYREVNLMYNFAQKLAETIDPASIAQLTLQEINNSINANSGLVVLLNEKKDDLDFIAASGEPFLTKEKLAQSDNGFQKLIAKEEAGILNDHHTAEGSSFSILYAPLKVKENILGTILLINKEGYQFTAADLKLLTTLSLQSAAAIESAQLYEKNIKEVKEREAAIRALHEVASRFVPNEFIKSLGYDKITQVTLGDSVEKEVTVLFSDIRGYTSLSENMTPSETFKFVNSFNNKMGPIILKNRGFINQYLGDGIMAIFPFSPSDALNAAIEMHKELQKYNNYRSTKNRSAIQIGIGLHTGSLIMGITGDDQRLDATTISDTVNTAARIESLTKVYGVNIMLTNYSLLKIQEEKKSIPAFDFQVRYLGAVQVKGKTQAVKIYECFDGDLPEIVSAKNDSLTLYESALSDFHNQKFLKAAATLHQIVSVNPQDRTALFLLEKTNRLVSEGVQANWNGVETMLVK